jgi:hypothetical protein
MANKLLTLTVQSNLTLISHFNSLGFSAVTSLVSSQMFFSSKHCYTRFALVILQLQVYGNYVSHVTLFSTQTSYRSTRNGTASRPNAWDT